MGKSSLGGLIAAYTTHATAHFRSTATPQGAMMTTTTDLSADQRLDLLAMTNHIVILTHTSGEKGRYLFHGCPLIGS